MANTKDQIISLVTQIMAGELVASQLDLLIYTMSETLQHYDITAKSELPSTDLDNTEKVIKMFLAAKKIEGCQFKTLLLYKYHILRFSQMVNADLLSVDTNTIRYYLGLVSRNTQNSYVDGIRRILNSFYQYLENEDMIPKNPCRKIKAIKIEKKMEEPFSDTEIALLQDACLTAREIAFVDLLISTGIRREEATKIRLSDITWESRSIKIHGKGAKQRIVYISAKCKLHLQQYVNCRGYVSEYLFASGRAPHGQLSVESLHKFIKDIGGRAGVSNVHLHRFRKWFGTSMADKGVDIRDLKEMMGHEKIDTTNNYYIYSNMTRVKAEHQKHAA